MYILCMDGVVREVNVRVIGKKLELLSVNPGRFEINQLLYQMMSEFGRVCEIRKLRVSSR